MSRLTFDNEIALLRRYAANAKLGIVELGVFDGETSRELCRASSVPVYGIDPIVPDSMPDYATGNVKTILYNTRGYNYRFYHDYSYNVLPVFNNPFDFIFIDASHIYDDVKRDFIGWFPKLAPGGFIAFHDSASLDSIPARGFKGWDGCIRLTNEIERLGYPVFVERVDTMKVYQK